jgi:hypothetical protein
MCQYWPTKYFHCCEKKRGLKKGEEKHLYLDHCDEAYFAGKECANIPISDTSVFYIFKKKCEACLEEDMKEAVLLHQIAEMQFSEKHGNEECLQQNDISGDAEC